MRIEQLQINDWVYIKDKDLNIYGNYKVEGIEKHEEGYGIVVSDRQLVFFDDCVEPIPLTEEILKKNGFYKDWDGNTYLMGELFRLTPLTDEMGYCLNKWFSVLIYSVHGLQHALRLCGLNELADNFVI